MARPNGPLALLRAASTYLMYRNRLVRKSLWSDHWHCSLLAYNLIAHLETFIEEDLVRLLHLFLGVVGRHVASRDNVCWMIEGL